MAFFTLFSWSVFKGSKVEQLVIFVTLFYNGEHINILQTKLLTIPKFFRDFWKNQHFRKSSLLEISLSLLLFHIP